MRRTAHCPLPRRPHRPAERTNDAGVVAGVRARLDPGPFAAAWAAGRALPLEDAIALALAVAGPESGAAGAA
ncbi:MAG TPA: hypothetical protein VH257_05995, partial [Chloroflexota bacterium]|nr:hypothetical protein [Chloroflexota bacterium]